jgi:hypothetical protein
MMMRNVNIPLAAPVSFHQDLINQLKYFHFEWRRRDIAEFLVV